MGETRQDMYYVGNTIKMGSGIKHCILSPPKKKEKKGKIIMNKNRELG